MLQALKRPMEADEEERKALTAAEQRYRGIAMTAYRRCALLHACCRPLCSMCDSPAVALMLGGWMEKQ